MIMITCMAGSSTACTGLVLSLFEAYPHTVSCLLKLLPASPQCIMLLVRPGLVRRAHLQLHVRAHRLNMPSPSKDKVILRENGPHN